jgi:hypothetical protein
LGAEDSQATRHSPFSYRDSAPIGRQQSYTSQATAIGMQCSTINQWGIKRCGYTTSSWEVCCFKLGRGDACQSSWYRTQSPCADNSEDDREYGRRGKRLSIDRRASTCRSFCRIDRIGSISQYVTIMLSMKESRKDIC